MVNVIRKSLRIFVLPFICILSSSSNLAAKPITDEASFNKSFAFFVENKGQITDQNHAQRKDIDFKFNADNGLNLFVGSGHMHYVWSRNIENDKHGNSRIATYRLDVLLEGANANVEPETFETATYYERYYTSEVKGALAHAYGKVVYKNIYKNIDWVLYTNDGGLKYDFIIRPGGNPADIKIMYKGAESIKMVNGNLMVTTPYGSITEKAPYTYRSYINTPVASSYHLDGEVMSFELGDYEGQIVIDPTLEWATYMGGTGNDYSYGIVADGNQNIYIAGKTNSQASNVVATSNSFQDTLTAYNDGYIVKYAPGGARQWGTYYGGNGIDVINALTINSSSELVFSGVTDTSYNLYVPNAHQATHGGGDGDCFMGKMSTSGALIWATYYGGAGTEREGEDFQTSVQCDGNDNIYLVGTTNSDTGIAYTNGVQQTSRSSLRDAFIAKFNTNGQRQWGTYYGGAYDDAFNNVAVAANGYVYVGGEFQSDGLGTSGTYSSTRISNNNAATNNPNLRDYDALIAKFNPYTGTVIWATYYGGNNFAGNVNTLQHGYDKLTGIAVADSNNLYIAGTTIDTMSISTPTVEQRYHGGGGSVGNFDAYLLKLDSNGARKWCTYVGGSAAEHAGAVVIDANGNPNITGRTGSSNNIATFDAHQGTIGGSFDAMIETYNVAGFRIWGSYYGGPGGDHGYGISTTVADHIYICGHSESSTGIWRSGAQQYNGGGNDAFLAKFTPDTSSFIFQPFTQTKHCQGDTFILNYGVTSTFRSGNTFKVQLSDNTGSFANPIDIGTTTSSTNGTIACGVPTNVNGSGFRIRIVGTAPIDTSYDNGVDIEINILPTKPVATNNGPICSSEVLQLNSTPFMNGVTYTWTGPLGFNVSSTTSANATRTNMSAGASGPYIVVADNNGCMRSDTTIVTIKQAAGKPRLESTTPVCNGQTMVLGANDLTINADLVFTGPAGFYDSVGNITSLMTVFSPRTNMTTAFNGDYIVTLKYNGCISSDTVTIAVQPNPAAVTATSNSPICKFETLVINGGTSTTGVDYNLYGNGGLVKKGISLPYYLPNPIPSYSGKIALEADLNGCKASDTINVLIKEATTQPKIVTTLLPKCTDDTFWITGTYLDSPVKSWWLRPGGIVDSNSVTAPIDVSIIEPLMTPAMNGRYYLYTEHVTTGCTRIDSIDINVEPFVPLDIEGDAIPGKDLCAGADYKLFVVGDSAITKFRYTWQQTLAHPPKTPPPPWEDTTIQPQRYNFGPTQAGPYIVKLALRSNECHYGKDTFSLNLINSIPAPQLTLQDKYCADDTIFVTPTHPSVSTFTLTYPGGTNVFYKTIGLNNLTKPKHEGMYVIKADAGGNCIAYDTAYVSEIKPNPLKPTIQGVKPICEGEALQLNASSTTNGVSYDWEGPSGFMSSQQNPTLTNINKALNEGYYKARSVLNGCKSSADSVKVNVILNPQPIVSDTSICEFEKAYFAVSNGSTGIEYNWESLVGNGFTASGSNATLDNARLPDGGLYVVYAKDNNTGCVGKDTSKLTVRPLPEVPDAFYNEPICEGKDLVLDLNDNNTDVSYVWTGPGGYTVFEKTVTRQGVQVNHSGTYIVTVNKENCFSSDSIKVTVLPTPETPQITSNSPLDVGEDLNLQLLNPVPGATYDWKGPNNYGSNLENPVISRVSSKQSGTYSLTTELGGCSSSAITVVTVKGEGIEKEEIVLFPNPNKGNFTVKAKVRYDQIMPYEVVTSVGHVVFRDIVTTQNLEMEEKITIEGVLPSGVYIFRIMMSGESREIPFTIIR